jgi:O-antigen biosynthesis protein
MNTTGITHSGSPERFDPRADGGKLVHSEHVARYAWASQLARGAVVLDAGCGTGYGTAILAEAGPERLLAVDVAEDAVAVTREATGDRAETSVADITALPFEDSSVDLAVCFEVIEHLERRDAAIRELARVLRPDGVLLISSPNRREYLPGNEFHVHEYTPEELETALREVFGNVRLHVQNAWLGSLLAGSDGADAAAGAGRLDADIELMSATRTREGTFVVAVAGDGPLPALENRLVLGDPFEVRWWAEEIEAARGLAGEVERRTVRNARELERTRERLRAAERRILEIEQGHASVVAERGELQSDLEEAQLELARCTEELAQARALRARADRVVLDMQASASWRLTRPLRRFKSLLRGSGRDPS